MLAVHVLLQIFKPVGLEVALVATVTREDTSMANQVPFCGCTLSTLVTFKGAQLITSREERVLRILGKVEAERVHCVLVGNRGRRGLFDLVFNIL